MGERSTTILLTKSNIKTILKYNLEKKNLNQKTYSYLLRRQEWINKRNYILTKYGRTCSKCGCAINLNVHHLFYITDALPWEYPDDAFLVLCEKHHKEWHDNYIVKVISKNKPKPRKKGVNRKGQKIMNKVNSKRRWRDAILRKRSVKGTTSYRKKINGKWVTFEK